MPVDPSVIPPEIAVRIVDELDRLEARHGVAVLFAVESGSRAWGFHSPDSDFDVRFVYVHPSDWYLTVRPGRDVIEAPIIEGLDISGWDVRKALALACKFNPVLPEWLRSPVVYRWHADLVACRCSMISSVTSSIRPRACWPRNRRPPAPI